MGRPGKVTRIDYGQFLFSSQVNYTQSYFGEHHPDASHDSLNRWMRGYRFTSAILWEHAKAQVIQSAQGYLVFDDTVLDKSHSHNIELVKLQYSGNIHGLVKGIGVVNCVYVNPDLGRFWVVDYRIYAPDYDGKTKLDHMREMFDNALDRKNISCKAVLMDTWYATSAIMQHINKRGKLFYCPLKSNRTIKTLNNTEYQSVSSVKWSKVSARQGRFCQLKGLDKNVNVKLFQVVRSTTQNETVITNDVAQSSAEVVQKVLSHRWKIEQFHRELKQNTGIEDCKCRNQRAQRNHIAMCMLVWLKFDDIAHNQAENIYQIKQSLLKEYIIQQLKSPKYRFA